MSAGVAKPAFREVRRPGWRTKFLAIVIIVALAALAAYAVYAPPTKVSVGSSTNAQPQQRAAPPAPAGEPEGESGEGGD